MNRQSLILADARNKQSHVPDGTWQSLILAKARNKLLVICGPTATGKTELGVYLAKKFNGEIVSADSRQVYRGMDIWTGKDLPESAKFKMQSEKLQLKVKNGQVLKPYRFGEILVWMLDVVDPTEQFSVAHYYKLANRVIEDIWQRGKLPILVGGTGLYIKVLTDGIDTIAIPPNATLRRQYKAKTQKELFAILEKLDPARAERMNPSDRNNPRRLIRALEIAQFKSAGRHVSTRSPASRGEPDGQVNQFIDTERSVLFIGLTAQRKVLYERIDKRVEERIKQGMVAEVEGLLKGGLSHERIQQFGLEYRVIDNYLQREISKEQMLKQLKNKIHAFARRQLTWFKNPSASSGHIYWFDIKEPNWQEKVEKKVEEWYNKNAKLFLYEKD